MKTLLLTVGLLALAIALLSVRMLLIKGGRFSSKHAHEVMRDYELRHNNRQ